jgi:DNA-binding transcriptional LysR family regulator
MRTIASVLAKLRLRQLALIMHTSDAGSLAEGAALSNVSQPAATKMLQESEELFGAKLFERTPKGMRPTRLGDVVTAYARTVVIDLQRVKRDLEAIEAGASGSVAVGTISGAGPSVLGAAVARFTRAQPGITVDIRVETSDVLIPKLLDGELDFAIGRPHGTAARELEFERLSGSAWQPVVVGVHHPLNRRDEVSPAELRRQQWILHPPGNLLRFATDAAFRSADLQPPVPSIETISHSFALSMLQHTELATIMPEGLARLYESRSLVHVLRTPLDVRLGPFGILLHKRRQIVPAARTLLDLIRHDFRGAMAGR